MYVGPVLKPVGYVIGEEACIKRTWRKSHSCGRMVAFTTFLQRGPQHGRMVTYTPCSNRFTSIISQHAAPTVTFLLFEQLNMILNFKFVPAQTTCSACTSFQSSQEFYFTPGTWRRTHASSPVRRCVGSAQTKTSPPAWTSPLHSTPAVEPSSLTTSWLSSETWIRRSTVDKARKP